MPRMRGATRHEKEHDCDLTPLGGHCRVGEPGDHAVAHPEKNQSRGHCLVEEPEGFPANSRWLRRARARRHHRNLDPDASHPGRGGRSSVSQDSAGFCDPSGVNCRTRPTGGIAGAQPPAIRCKPSGFFQSRNQRADEFSAWLSKRAPRARHRAFACCPRCPPTRSSATAAPPSARRRDRLPPHRCPGLTR